MSLRVAMQPSADIKQLITNGRTGTGDMFSGVLVSSLSVSDRSIHVTTANLRFPLQEAIDGRALAVFFTEVQTCHIAILEQKTSRCQRGRRPQVIIVMHIMLHYG